MSYETGKFMNAAHANATIEDAKALATKLHDGQMDHSGKPYIFHPTRVVKNLLQICPNAHPDVIMACWLHDTIEDCNINEDYLRQLRFSENCIAMIKAVTKPENDDRDYDQVINDLIATGNIGAMLIKIADNMDNLHPDRIADLMIINPEKAERLRDRYRASIKKLSHAAGVNLQDVLIFIQNAPRLAT